MVNSKNKNVLKQTILVTSMLFNLSSCQKKALRFQPDNPDKLLRTKKYNPQLSQLNTSFHFNTDELEKTINRSLPNEFYRDDSFSNNGNDRLKLIASKVDKISISGGDEKIKFKVPVYIKLDYDKSIHVKSDAKIELYFESDIELSDMWELETKTASRGYKWIEKPAINNFFGMKVKVPSFILSFLEKEINNQLKEIAPMLDSQIAENLNLKLTVSELWEGIQKPLLLDEEYKVWLSVKPQEFLVSPLEGNDEMIKLQSQINLYPDLKVGDKPIVDSIIGLPMLQKQESLEDSFSLQVSNIITYVELNRILREELVGYEYKQGKKTIIVSEVKLFPNGDYLYVNVSFNGSVEGNIYLRGIPSVDQEKDELYLKNLNFDIKTKKAAVQIADFIIHGAFKKTISNKLRYPLKKYYNEAEVGIENGLSDVLKPPLYINCDVTNIYADDIYLEEKGLNVIVELFGKAVVNYGR